MIKYIKTPCLKNHNKQARLKYLGELKFSKNLIELSKLAGRFAIQTLGLAILLATAFFTTCWLGDYAVYLLNK